MRESENDKMEDPSVLRDKLETYEKNLQKVNDLLTSNAKDENLIKIRQDLIKVIDLTKTLIQVSAIFPLVCCFILRLIYLLESRRKPTWQKAKNKTMALLAMIRHPSPSILKRNRRRSVRIRRPSR